MSVHTKYKHNKAIYNHSQTYLTYKSLFKMAYKIIQNNNITLNTKEIVIQNRTQAGQCMLNYGDQYPG